MRSNLCKVSPGTVESCMDPYRSPLQESETKNTAISGLFEDFWTVSDRRSGDSGSLKREKDIW